MHNTIVYLIGHYGVGKLTVAQAICRKTNARLFDNHLANNVVFSLIRADGRTPLPKRVWDYIERIRTIAVEAIADLAAPEMSFVLTNALTDDPMDWRAFEQIVDLAGKRGAIFLPVMLDCAEEENARRVADLGRAERLKHTDAASAIARRRTIAQLPVDHPNRLDLDTTHLSADDAADRIIAYAKGLTS